jgi:hypothetical protein
MCSPDAKYIAHTSSLLLTNKYDSLSHNDITGIKRFAGKLPIHSDAVYLCNLKHRILNILAPNLFEEIKDQIEAEELEQG